MDSLSDSSRCEFDSITSGDSLHFCSDELRARFSTPDLSNSELAKRVASLELENERLRVELENLRIELSAKIAANQGLKDKITVFYVDSQSAMQEKLKLQSNLKNLESRLTSAENSTKWYQQQVHQAQATKKTLQIEIETYQEMLKQKQQAVADTISKCSQINKDYANLVAKFKEEKDLLQNEINMQRLQKENENLKELSPEPKKKLSLDLSTKLEATEEELRETKAQLCILNQRLLSTEAEKNSVENSFAKHSSRISSLEDNLQRLESEKNELEKNFRESCFQIEKLKSENEAAELTLTTSRQNQGQVEEAISQLQTQLSKMITQYKVVKIRNSDLEGKVTSMQETLEENKRLKLLSFNANSSLLKKLKSEKQKVKKLETLISQKETIQKRKEENRSENAMENCLQQALDENKELKEQLKSITRVSEESIDEGYADGTSLGHSSTNLPSSPTINPVLLMEINNILYRSKHFLRPIQMGVCELQSRIEKFKEEQNTKFQILSPNCYNNRSISAVSSPNNTRTLV